jgi:hypothetical protein
MIDIAQHCGALDTGAYLAIHINFDVVPGHSAEIFALFEKKKLLLVIHRVCIEKATQGGFFWTQCET